MDEKEITYELYVNEEWQAGSNDLEEAMRYVSQYMADGNLQLFEVESKRTLIVEIGGDI
jgi:hypothetical protein